MPREPVRCGWCLGKKTPDPLMVAYHDTEWGVPVHDDERLFEFLVLESMQAGLSWAIVLRKRENFRRAFAAFDPVAVARFGAKDVARLCADPGIIRNRAKIQSVVKNARAFLAVREEFGSFARYIWGFVDGRPIRHSIRKLEDLPARSPESDRIAADMKRRGFSFMGSTIVYAHMQATGMVNDHLVQCFRYRQVAGKR
ncbi:MAG: DNA-3-methyladenine glycosylase I [Myxococcales bacterium]|nr:DNA-3-methyladenine glycosylase I [Myxococcales bacterium]